MKNIFLLSIIFMCIACNKKNNLKVSQSLHTITFKAWGGPGNKVTYNDGTTSTTVMAYNASSWTIQKEIEGGKSVSTSATNSIPGSYVGVSILDNGSQVAYLVASQWSSVSYTIK